MRRLLVSSYGGGVISKLIDIVVPACGHPGVLKQTVSDMLRRDCDGVRIVIISSGSSNSGCHLRAVRCVRECTSSPEIGCVGRGVGRDKSTTHGAKVRGSMKRCVTFLSSSSCFFGSQMGRTVLFLQGSGISYNNTYYGCMGGCGGGVCGIDGGMNYFSSYCRLLSTRVSCTTNSALVVGERMLGGIKLFSISFGHRRS